MNYIVNGNERSSDSEITLSTLLQELSLDPTVVVAEKNREIVDRDEYDNTSIREGDNLELLSFVGGG